MIINGVKILFSWIVTDLRNPRKSRENLVYFSGSCVNFAAAKFNFLALYVARGFRNLKTCLPIHLICHILKRLCGIPQIIEDITQKP